MAKTDPKSLKAHPVTGLVPVKFKISEAGAGIRLGEIRGVPPEVAARMIDSDHADAVDPVVDGAKAPKTDDKKSDDKKTA